MKNIRLLPSALIATTAAVMSDVQTVSAQISNPALGGNFGTHPGNNQGFANRFGTLFIRFWNVAITLGAILVILYLIWGAVEWIGSGGDSGKLEKARNKMLHAVVGLFLLVSMFVILIIINTLVFNCPPGSTTCTFNILQLNFPTP